MPTFQVTLKYEVVSSDTSGRGTVDPLTDSPLIAVYIEFRGKYFIVGKVKLSELRLLTGTSTEYNAVVAETTATGVPSIVTDNTHNNEEFTAWAALFPDSILTPFLSEMHK